MDFFEGQKISLYLKTPAGRKIHATGALQSSEGKVRVAVTPEGTNWAINRRLVVGLNPIFIKTGGRYGLQYRDNVPVAAQFLVNGRFLNSVRQIHLKTDSPNFEAVGSAVLVWSDRSPVLLTAAHVADLE